MKTLVATIFILLLSVGHHAFAQSGKMLKPLELWNELPPLTIGNILNFNGRTLKTDDFKNKLVVIDFWATTCGGCIDQMPRIQRLQKKYGSSVFLLPVTYEDKKYVDGFDRRNHIMRKIGLPIVTNDKQLAVLFPHQLLGHVIWIRDGRYVAATDVDHITDEGIAAALHGETAMWHQQKDVLGFNRGKPVFTFVLNSQLWGAAPLYSDCISGNIPGLPMTGGHGIDSTKGTRWDMYINFTLLHLYTIALNSPLAITPNRRVIETKDPSKYIYTTQQGFRDDWYREHSFTYQSTTPQSTGDSVLRKKFKHDLDIYFHTTGSIEKRETICLALRIKTTGKLKANTQKEVISLSQDSIKAYIHYSPLSNLVYSLNHMDDMPPVFDETGYSRPVDLDFTVLPKDPAQWNIAIAPYGLELVPERKVLDMFILQENN